MLMPRSDSGLVMAGASALLIKGGFNIAYNCQDETPMVLMVHVHPERERDLIEPELVTCYPSVPTETYIDGFGNACSRIVAPPGPITRVFAPGRRM